MKKKVQHFVWRACHNKIPVEVNLKKRGIKVEGVCRQCGEEMETVECLFFHCQRAKNIWKLAPVQWDGLQQFTWCLKDWWRKQGEVGKEGAMKDRQDFTAYLIWQIWKARNSRTFHKEYWSEMEIIKKAWEEWSKFKDVQANQPERSNRSMQTVHKEP